MSLDTSASSRFFRPADAGRIRRNQRRLQVQQTWLFLRNAVGVLAVAALAGWGWQELKASNRFAVTSIEVDGVTHTSRSAIDAVTARYAGVNLFQIDIARLQDDLGRISWIRHVDVEKELPGTLRVIVKERTPVALLRSGERLFYVDVAGTRFAELSPSVGSDDLPIINDAEGAELARAVGFLRALKDGDRELYSRVSELWSIPPHGFALWDRSLGGIVYVNQEDAVQKWRSLYAILHAERNPKIEYADLRFSDRVIVKSIRDITATEGVLHAQN